jgi:hypothetical protein
MRGTIHEHKDLWENLGAGIGFALAAVLLLRMVLAALARSFPR